MSTIDDTPIGPQSEASVQAEADREERQTERQRHYREELNEQTRTKVANLRRQADELEATIREV